MTNRWMQGILILFVIFIILYRICNSLLLFLFFLLVFLFILIRLIIYVFEWFTTKRLLLFIFDFTLFIFTFLSFFFELQNWLLFRIVLWFLISNTWFVNIRLRTGTQSQVRNNRLFLLACILAMIALLSIGRCFKNLLFFTLFNILLLLLNSFCKLNSLFKLFIIEAAIRFIWFQTLRWFRNNWFPYTWWSSSILLLFWLWLIHLFLLGLLAISLFFLVFLILFIWMWFFNLYTFFTRIILRLAIEI